MKRIILCPFALLASVNIAQSAITLTKDSTVFNYRYEMTAQPNNQDLDSNLTDDWFDTGAPTVSGGFAVNTANDQLFRGDFSGSIWRSVANAAAADWTMEIRVAKTVGAQGTNGWFGIATANASESNSSRVYIKDDRIVSNGADYLVGGGFGDGSYVTIRIAHDAVDNNNYFWVNGTLLNTNLSTPILGINGTSFDNSTFIGDYSATGFDGDFSIDYIRLDTGAFAPVPEPGATLLGGIGMLLLLRRRR